MFALRSLGKMVWGSKESPEAYKIDTGVLYEVRPDTRVPRKCLFKDAELVIRRTTVPFNYQLVAVRVFEEGEEDLADNGQALDDERAFLIGAELRFTSATIDNAAGFKWEDASGVPRVYYEFVSDAGSVTAEKRSQFALAVARCAWERQNRESYTAADPEEIDRIVTMVEDEELEQILMNAKIDDEELGAMEQPVPEKNPKKSRQPSGPQLPAPPRKMKAGDITLSVLGGLYIFDPSKTEFVMVAPEVTLAVVNPAKYEYWINVVSDECKYLSQVIDPGMNAVFNHDYRSLIWNYFDANGKAYSFSLVADDDEHYDTMHQGMTRAAYETLNQEPWKKATVSAQDYMLDAYEEDVAMPTAPEEWDGSEGSEEETEEESGDEEESESEDDDDRHESVPDRFKTSRPVAESDETDSEDYESESESEPESDEESGDERPSTGSGSRSSQAENSMLAVGYKNDRSFVVRGTKIGVFKHTDDDQISFDTTINRIDDTHGREFIPKATMLSEQDSAMVLMDQQRPNELYRMDLERGKVVEEWKVHEDIPTVAIAHNTKYGQMTGDKTLVGLSHNLIYRIDPRVGGDNLIVQDEMMAYTTKSHFTAAATTESGAVVVGSEKGDIRMFDRVGVRAKTVLPALGEPIIGIDVTSDGRYVVATCKNYLLLIDTRIPDDTQGRTGFETSFPKQKKPAPKRLQLKPEHVVYMGGPVSFTPARFNQSPEGNSVEDSIVTSTGPFVITWNLRRVLGSGRGDAYHIKQYSDRVVADNFRFGQDNAIVVTLPNDVQSIKRSQLTKPTRKSLMVPKPVAKRLASPRHDIVNSPY